MGTFCVDVNRCKTSSLHGAVLRKSLLNYLKQQIAHAWIDESGNWVVHLWRTVCLRAKDGLGIGRARARDRIPYGPSARNDVRKPHTCHCVNQL